MKDDKEPARNPKLKVMMAAICIAIVINSIIAAYAPTILGCAGVCDINGQNLVVTIFIKFGQLFPRVQAYRLIQEGRGFAYPWPALAFSYGIFWFEFLIGIVVTWPLIVIDSLQWGRTHDFTKPLKPTQDPRTVILAAIAAAALIVWGVVISSYFAADHRGSGTPSFSTNMLPAGAVPTLYLLLNLFFAVIIRTQIISRKTRAL